MKREVFKLRIYETFLKGGECELDLELEKYGRPKKGLRWKKKCFKRFYLYLSMRSSVPHSLSPSLFLLVSAFSPLRKKVKPAERRNRWSFWGQWNRQRCDISRQMSNRKLEKIRLTRGPIGEFQNFKGKELQLAVRTDTVCWAGHYLPYWNASIRCLPSCSASFQSCF